MSEDIDLISKVTNCSLWTKKKCWVVQTQKSVPNEDKIWPLKNIKKRLCWQKEGGEGQKDIDQS